MNGYYQRSALQQWERYHSPGFSAIMGGMGQVWINSSEGAPGISGRLHISSEHQKVFIVGDPEALHSLARLLVWIADKDQETIVSQPVGERFHIHLYPEEQGGCLVESSCEAELCRLDAKKAPA